MVRIRVHGSDLHLPKTTAVVYMNKIGILIPIQYQCFKVSKFDQIASKFEQIPPKPLDAFHHTVQPELHYTTTSSAQQSTSFTDTTVPNLRIDYFAESKKMDTLDDSQKLTHNPGAINVTPNPMDTPVCTQPRATIVVQQVRFVVVFLN